MKVKIGDKVLVNNNAFDEQFERMETPNKIYEISEIKKVGAGTSGQWAKIKGGIKMVNLHSNQITVTKGWIDSAWLKKENK